MKSLIPSARQALRACGARFLPPRWLVAACMLATLVLPCTRTHAQATLDNGATLEILGTGTASLIGGDLTDPENDGDESLGETDPSWNWVSISSNNEPGFGGGEYSYNVFDNLLGANNDKWCCDDATEAAPKNITVEFPDVVRLTYFTVSSANDTPTRDPQDWQIQGSNDGIEFTPIFIQSNDTPIWTERLQVAKITLDPPGLPYKFIRFEATRTADSLYQLGEIEYFGEFGFGGPKIEILGTGNAALLGSPLTDPENDGNEAAGPNDPSWNGNVFFANDKAFFNGGEGSFNLFDHKLTDGDAKMCCTDPTVASPIIVGVTFPRAASISHFTISSANDAPGRDPRRWKLQGSNDSTTWTDIFVQDSDVPLWTERNQVIKITLERPSAPFQSIRYIVTDTADSLHQLGELELFGRFGGASIPHFGGVRSSRTQIFLKVVDGLDTSLNQASVVVKIDGVVVSTTASKADTTTTLTFTNGSKYDPASTHTYEITGKDSAGNDLSFTGSVTVPIPTFPDADLPGPAIVDGAWSTRYIFASGTIDSIPAVLARVNAIGAGTFETDFPGGLYFDATSEVINHNAGGLFGNPLPYDEGAVAMGGCCTDNFTMVSFANIRIPEDGTYTFGVHSDDGFAMRIRGGQAISVSGNGSLDPADPEAVVHPANTGDSSTRGVYSLKAGVYRIEFFWWEAGGGDFGEIYAAKGSFANDGDTPSWRLVGDHTPSESFIKLGVDANGWSVVSSEPGGTAINTWADANADLEAGVSDPVIYDLLNVGDPDTNGGVLAFPRDALGDQDDYVLKATGTLVIPEDGTYSIGFNTDDGGYVKIPGQTFTEITVNGTGKSVIGDSDTGTGDTVTCDCLTGDSATVATITLTKGTYTIEAGMFERGGGSFLAVRGGQLGSPQLQILAKNGTGSYRTDEALQLTTDSVGLANNIVKIELVGANAVITFRPGTPGASYKLAQSSNLTSWTQLDNAGVVAGSDLVFTVPAAPGAVFFRVVKQ